MAGNEHLKTSQSGQVGGVLDGDIGSSSTSRAVDIFRRFGCCRRFRDGSRHFVLHVEQTFECVLLISRVGPVDDEHKKR